MVGARIGKGVAMVEIYTPVMLGQSWHVGELLPVTTP